MSFFLFLSKRAITSRFVHLNASRRLRDDDQAWKSEKADKDRGTKLSQLDRRGFKGGGGVDNGGGDDGDEQGEKALPSTVPAQGKRKKGTGLVVDGQGGGMSDVFFLQGCGCGMPLGRI